MSTNLDDWLWRARMTRSSLAVKVGVTPQNVGRVARGAGHFSAPVLAQVARVVSERVPGASVGDVLTGLICPEADDWCPGELGRGGEG